MGELMLLQPEIARAETYYRMVLQLDPDYIIALNNLAWTLSLIPGRGAEALQLVNRAIDVAGAIPGLLDTRGMIHLRAGRTAYALADLQEATQESESPLTYLHYALALVHDDKFQRAIGMLETAKTLGLRRETLHPLEQRRCDELTKALRSDAG